MQWEIPLRTEIQTASLHPWRHPGKQHGNLPVTPKVLLELTELKYEAAILAYQSIKLSFGMPLDSPPSPQQLFFMTDAFMYVD